ncbi:PREDICTED: secreted frizzled-related protein 5 [Tinamus guttatus]|uniref:secreted frizzled-related protein 5 n=1 Tax=Tinamus guttatus TaxID=94827 RepID=UPI00052F403F|nr:PREDICTED: secreted frizzled-related protein 5 [Tinamus guttatus]
MPWQGSAAALGTALLVLALARAQNYDYYSWQPESQPHGRYYGREPQCVDIPADMQLCRDVGYKRMRSGLAAAGAGGTFTPVQPLLLLLLTPWFGSQPWAGAGPGAGPQQQSGHDAGSCLPAVSKICTQCEMEHKADGMMEQMCSSDFVVKMRIKEMTEENGERRLVAAQKKKVLKLGPLKRKDTKKMVLHMRNAGACPCPQLDSLSGSFLVMGRKAGGRLLLPAIYPWQKHNKEMKFAVKFMFSYPCPLYHPLLYGAGQR